VGGRGPCASLAVMGRLAGSNWCLHCRANIRTVFIVRNLVIIGIGL
jgi:hypothetical protein